MTNKKWVSIFQWGRWGLAILSFKTDTVRKKWHLLGFSGECEVFKFHLHINRKIHRQDLHPMSHFQNTVTSWGERSWWYGFLFWDPNMDGFSALDVRGVFWMLESSYGTPRSSRKSRRHHRPPLRRGSSSRVEMVQGRGGGRSIHTTSLIFRYPGV